MCWKQWVFCVLFSLFLSSLSSYVNFKTNIRKIYITTLLHLCWPEQVHLRACKRSRPFQVPLSTWSRGQFSTWLLVMKLQTLILVSFAAVLTQASEPLPSIVTPSGQIPERAAPRHHKVDEPDELHQQHLGSQSFSAQQTLFPAPGTEYVFKTGKIIFAFFFFFAKFSKLFVSGRTHHLQRSGIRRWILAGFKLWIDRHSLVSGGFSLCFVALGSG